MHSILRLMDLPESDHELERDLAATRDELVELDRRDAQLESALDDVEHDIRRCRDTLERSGWRSPEAQARNVLLIESRAAIFDDREKIRHRRAELSERLAVISRRLGEDNRDA
jgi:septal ring factor EnvC (AmiA/AmiB activator)